MKEQSHKAEMSAALRGDFQRLRARGVSAALVPQDDREPDEEPAAESPTVVEPPPAAAAEEPSEMPSDPPAAPTADEPEDEPSARRGWLSRLAGR